MKFSDGLRKAGKVCGFVAGVGATAMIGKALTLVPTKGIKGLKKLCIPMGIVGLSWAAANLADNATQDEFNGVADAIDSISEHTEEIKESFKDLKEAMSSNEEPEEKPDNVVDGDFKPI